jgi:hypothetical protein
VRIKRHVCKESYGGCKTLEFVVLLIMIPRGVRFYSFEEVRPLYGVYIILVFCACDCERELGRFSCL